MASGRTARAGVRARPAALTQPASGASSSGAASRGVPRRPGQSASDASDQAGKSAQARSGASLHVLHQLPSEVLYRGRARLTLIRDIAMGEWSNRELADQVGVTTEAIAAFAAEHADEISEVRAALAGQLAIETAGLWVTKKQNRLAEMQQDIEDCEAILNVMRGQGVSHKAAYDATEEIDFGPGLGTRRHFNLMKTKLALLRAVADEVSPRAANQKGPDDEEHTSVNFVVQDDDVMEQI